MKKFINKHVIAAVLAIVLSVVLVGCGGKQEIALDISEVKTVFEVGAEFTHDNLVVFTKNGDVNERVKKSEYTVSSPDMSSAGKKTVTVTYGDLTATYEIEVVVKEAVAVFTGQVTFGLGGGNTIGVESTLTCYNTLEWEITGSGMGGIINYTDSGTYTVMNGVYTLSIGSGAKIPTATDAAGNVTFGYEGFGIRLGPMTANGHGTLTLQK